MAAFADHLAVVLHRVLDVDTIRSGTGYWKMNVALLQNILYGKTTAAIGTMERAEKIFPRHGDVVGLSSKKTNPFTFLT